MTDRPWALGRATPSSWKTTTTANTATTTGKPGGLALGYAAPPDHAYAQTLAILARILDPHPSSA
jgi:hypothetical protein